MIHFVMNMAVNMDNTIPNARVCANPFTVPGPKTQSTPAAINVVTLPSMIAEFAFSKPMLMASFTVAPRPIPHEYERR